MPGLRKIVSSFGLSKIESDVQIAASHTNVAAPDQGGAKLRKRNTNVISKNGLSGGNVEQSVPKLQEANVARPTLAKRFIRSLMGTKTPQHGSDTAAVDSDAAADIGAKDELNAAEQFEEESRAVAALAGNLGAIRPARMLRPHRGPIPFDPESPFTTWSRYDDSEIARLARLGYTTLSAQEIEALYPVHSSAFLPPCTSGRSAAIRAHHERNAQGVSPPDSAMAYPEENLPPCSGTAKGKERAVSGSARPWREDSASSAADEYAKYCGERFAYDVRDDPADILDIHGHLVQEWEETNPSAGPSRTRECAVCGDRLPPLDFPAHAPTPKCGHLPQTCTECLQSWMASEFDTKGCSGITCSECKELMEYGDVRRAASAAIFEAYDKMAMRNALSSLSEFAWCLGCDSGQLNPDNHNFMDCASCGYKQCLKHKIKWHTGETCDQFEYRNSGQQARDEELATEATLDAISKKCPGPGCGWRIQKISGCDHMRCKRCRHEFCWQCLAAQQKIREIGNTAHDTSCKFHSENLDVAWPFNAH